MDERIERILSWIKGEKKGPFQIQVHLTNFCNLKCFFCPTRSLLKKEELDKNNELTKNDWFRIINEAKKLNVKEWHICGGGEPLFDKDLAYNVMKRIKKEGFYGEIITNGTLFTPDMIKNLVEKKWDKITFSIDGPDAKTNDQIRGVKCFEKAIKNIRLFSKYKKKFKHQKPRLCFHTVICNRNIHSLPKLIKLASKLEVQDVLFNALNIWREEIKKLQLNNKEINFLQEKLNDIDNQAKNLGISTNIKEFLNADMANKANKIVNAMKEELSKEENLVTSPCYIPWYNMSIFADGRVQPCFILQDQGDSCKEKSIKDIWYGKYFERIRNLMIKKELNEVCCRCNPWSFSKNSKIKETLRKIFP